MKSLRTLARTHTLRHPSGIAIDLPLLVPSFSSKGFGISSEEGSEISDIYKVSIEILTESMLISAYDIFHGFIPSSAHTITNLTFVDSGGYEVAEHHDLSAVFRSTFSSKPWSVSQLQSVYSSWHQHVPAAFVSYDEPGRRMSLREQIESATELFSAYPGQFSDLLIKPETKQQRYVQIDSVIAAIQDFAVFDIIGFTEKELGNTLLDRMVSIAKVRIALRDRGMDTPIHVFGSLDPITSVLYFLSGADIFDGLTWLRYGYVDGAAAYVHNFGAVKVGIDKREDQIKSRLISDNYYYLTELQHRMNVFAMDQEFRAFEKRAQFFQDAFNKLRLKEKRLK